MMKKILALALVLCLVAAVAACAQVVRISIADPSRIMVEKEGGSVAITLTDEKTVGRITDVVCQIPLQSADDNGEDWTYRIVWLDADGGKITEITIHGLQIHWEGKSYNLSVGVDLSVLTDLLDKIPVPNK